MAKISTTQKVLKAMEIYLDREENFAGVSSKDLWKHLESIPAIKLEIYRNGKRRDNIMTGITTRIREGKIQGIKVEKRDKHLYYVKDC